MPDEPFRGRVAMVTGGSGGIGRACALALAEAGADLAVNYWDWPERVESLAAEARKLGRRVWLSRTDLTDQAAVEAMVAAAIAELGRVDHFVSAAVYSDREWFVEADMTGFRRTLDVSMWGAFYALRAVARQMIAQGEGGSMVVVSSPHAHLAIPTCMAYNMAKAANDQMARTAAIELIGHRIRVNLIYPGWTDTPGERKFFTEETLAQAGAVLPMGRMAQPSEVARGAVFLLHPESSYITGTTLSIDGGSQLPWWSKRGTGEL